ncbi:hypothetical protein [Nocardioides maradonensis]
MWRKGPRAREVVLHIGTGKTGTSAIQRFLADHRGELAAGGVLYPRAMGPVRHTHLGHSAKLDQHLVGSLVWQRGGHTDPAAYRAHHETALVEEVREVRPDRVLFSDEGLYALGPVALRRLREQLDRVARQRTVLVYLRPQDEHLVSRYQQSVKVGETATLAEFAARDHSDLYDYARRLAMWEEAMAPARVVVRPFQRDRFAGGTLIGDLVAAVDLPVAVPQTEDVRRNESLDAEAVELLRLLNVAAVAKGAKPGAIDNLAVVDRLATLPRGPVLTLPDDVLDAFAARWAAGNAEVERRYLDGAPLFTGSRRTSATTTHQGLSPERYAELRELVGAAG